MQIADLHDPESVEIRRQPLHGNVDATHVGPPQRGRGARVGQLVQWDVMAMGDEFHTFHVHGHRWRTDGGTPEDTRGLGPAESFRVRWREDAPGTWLYHCHVESHMMNGMISFYRVGR